MKKITFLLILMLTLMLSVSCDSDDGGGTGSTPPKEWVGDWLSAGADVAPLLVAVFNYDSIRVNMTDDGLVTTESHIAGGAWSTISGTYSVTESATGDVHSIHLIYPTFEQEGIVQIITGTPDQMKLEVVQTVPDIGAIPRTPETGFGSDATLGTVNIQTYKKQ